jgi:hypothetical protein
MVGWLFHIITANIRDNYENTLVQSNTSAGVSNIAQIPNGQKRQVKIIDTPSQSVRSSIQSAPEPIRVSVASLRNSRAKGTTLQLPSILRGESLTRLLQGAAVGAVATMIIGFNWGGWTLGSTAEKQVKDAEQASIVRVLAPICADKFQHSADAGTNLEALKKTDSWNRDKLIEKAGWATFPGSEPDRHVAEACANLLSQSK